MSHFNLKSLIFYGVAIASVLALFEVVTAYGESNLKAPTAIDGRYRLSYTQPNCGKANALVLVIQQSGIYLNGSLLPALADDQQLRSAEKRPTLAGQMYNQQISLAGTVPTSILCNNISETTASDRPLGNSFSSIKLHQARGENLTGEMSVSGSLDIIEFTAQKEAPPQPSNNRSY